MPANRSRSPDPRRFREHRTAHARRERSPYGPSARTTYQDRERRPQRKEGDDRGARSGRDRSPGRSTYVDRGRRNSSRETGHRQTYRPLSDALKQSEATGRNDDRSDHGTRHASPHHTSSVVRNQSSTEQRQASSEPGLAVGAEEDAEAQMAAMMGFGGFGTTKGSKVKGNASAGAISRPAKKIEYRQYMNRIGGQKPLESS